MRWLHVLARLRLDLALCLSLAVTPVAAGDFAYVSCQNGDGLSVIDLEAATEVARWDVPGKPAGVAVSPGNVYTVAADAKIVRRHDPKTGDVLSEITLDGGPVGVAVDVGRGHLFISDWYNARIWVLDAMTLARQQDLQTGAAPAGLDLSPDGHFLAAADRDADQVSIFDAETLILHGTVKVGVRPFGLRFAPDGTLFVANVGSNDVTVIDPETLVVTATFPVGERPYGVAFANDRVFVSNQYADSVSVVGLDGFSALATVETGEYPEGIAVTSDGGTIVVANWFDNTVSLIDPQTMSQTASIGTCDGPRAFGAFTMKATP